MASEKYQSVLIYLHREYDKDIIEHLRDLPRSVRQDFARDALRCRLPGSKKPAGPPAARPAGLQTFGDSDDM